MKKRIFTTVLLACSFFICLAAITDLNGKWKGTVKIAGEDDLALTYNFKVDGEKLTGSVMTPQGELPISDGVLAGTDFTFKVKVSGTTVFHTAKYYGDSVVVSADLNGETLRSTLKRIDK